MKSSLSGLAAACWLLGVAPGSAVTLITLNFDAGVTEAQKPYFQWAADFWNSTITGYDLIHDGDGAILPHGLSITVSTPFLDGSGGILGAAGPDTATYYDNNPLGPPTLALYYATTGSMEFDSTDVDDMISSGIFYGVVLHEMAHVLGIGSLWISNTDVAGPGTHNLYTTGSGEYYGPAALNAWRTEYNQPTATFVPVEMGGGPGTAEGHWNENEGGIGLTGFVSNIDGSDFTRELMTGWSSNPFHISTVTLGALDDLGYTVDYSKAGVVPVPEPAVAGLTGLAALALFRRRRP